MCLVLVVNTIARERHNSELCGRDICVVMFTYAISVSYALLSALAFDFLHFCHVFTTRIDVIQPVSVVIIV